MVPFRQPFTDIGGKQEVLFPVGESDVGSHATSLRRRYPIIPRINKRYNLKINIHATGSRVAFFKNVQKSTRR
jgi:hypothetical protein